MSAYSILMPLIETAAQLFKQDGHELTIQMTVNLSGSMLMAMLAAGSMPHVFYHSILGKPHRLLAVANVTFINQSSQCRQSIVDSVIPVHRAVQADEITVFLRSGKNRAGRNADAHR